MIFNLLLRNRINFYKYFDKAYTRKCHAFVPLNAEQREQCEVVVGKYRGYILHKSEDIIAAQTLVYNVFVDEFKLNWHAENSTGKHLLHLINTR